MKRRFCILFPVFCLFAVFVTGCGAQPSHVPFSGISGHAAALHALSPAAVQGILEGRSAAAWFSCDPSRAGLVDRKKHDPANCGIEVDVVNEAGPPVTISLGFVTRSDIGPDGVLSTNPAPRALAVAERSTGSVHLRMLLPETGNSGVCGFAVQVTGADSTRVRITAASVAPAETGWQKKGGTILLSTGPEGGLFDVSAIRAGPEDGNAPGKAAPSVNMSPNSVLTLYFAPAGTSAGTHEKQAQTVFSDGTGTYVFRKSPSPAVETIPSFLRGDNPARITVQSGAENLSGMLVSRSRHYPVADEKASLAPVSADPSMIIDWPQSAWRRPDFEVFCWDHFPSILIFDTADYAVQDKLFKRMAFFVEKDGYRGKLCTDSEIAKLHAYNAHDYRAESLAAFFDAAAKKNFELDEDELQLRDILIAEGIILKAGSGYKSGAGAVLSISRQSVEYLRYMFIAHEGYHGIYFINPDYRAVVSGVYKSMDARAIRFLKTYFTVVDSLGYDTDDPYLMENEFMAYLMQQPLDRVGMYFTGTLHERFVRYRGDPELAKYIVSSGASEFVRAATTLNDYVFSRWGLSGGRVGLYIPQ